MDHSSEQQILLNYTLQIADSAFILGHKVAEWTGHGPVLEQDIALTNIALDLIGEARFLYQFAATLEKGKTEDSYPYLRDNREWRNVLLTELPNGDFAQTIVRQFLYDAFDICFLDQLASSAHDNLSGIAQKSIKASKYHFAYSSEWLKRLGDGTEESHKRTQRALDKLWPYTGELVTPSTVDILAHNEKIGVDLNVIRDQVTALYKEMIIQSNLVIPETPYMHSGGKDGVHTENLGHILSDLQYMQKTYPGLEW